MKAMRAARLFMLALVLNVAVIAPIMARPQQRAEAFGPAVLFAACVGPQAAACIAIGAGLVAMTAATVAMDDDLQSDIANLWTGFWNALDSDEQDGYATRVVAGGTQVLVDEGLIDAWNAANATLISDGFTALALSYPTGSPYLPPYSYYEEAMDVTATHAYGANVVTAWYTLVPAGGSAPTGCTGTSHNVSATITMPANSLANVRMSLWRADRTTQLGTTTSDVATSTVASGVRYTGALARSSSIGSCATIAASGLVVKLTAAVSPSGTVAGDERALYAFGFGPVFWDNTFLEPLVTYPATGYEVSFAETIVDVDYAPSGTITRVPAWMPDLNGAAEPKTYTGTDGAYGPGVVEPTAATGSLTDNANASWWSSMFTNIANAVAGLSARVLGIPDAIVNALATAVTPTVTVQARITALADVLDTKAPFAWFGEFEDAWSAWGAYGSDCLVVAVPGAGSWDDVDVELCLPDGVQSITYAASRFVAASALAMWAWGFYRRLVE